MAKKDPKMTPSKPVGTGATRLKFDNSPKISPTDEASKSNPKMETGLFSKDALGSQMPADGQYAAKAKKGYFNESTFEHEMPNTVFPTDSY